MPCLATVLGFFAVLVPTLHADATMYSSYTTIAKIGTHGIDGAASHVYTLNNRVNSDGSNMIYLSVDGVEPGAMNNYFIGAAAQGTTSDWLSGKDFTFTYFGTPPIPPLQLHHELSGDQRGLQP